MARDKAKKYEMDMCNGPILKKMLIFAIPLICSGILQLLFNAADIIVVGRFAGDNSLAAVGSTSSLVHLFVNLFIGMSVAANVLVARFYAGKQDRDLSETVHTSIALSLISGVFLMIAGIIIAPLAYYFGAAILRAIGDS